MPVMLEYRRENCKCVPLISGEMIKKYLCNWSLWYVLCPFTWWCFHLWTLRLLLVCLAFTLSCHSTGDCSFSPNYHVLFGAQLAHTQSAPETNPQPKHSTYIFLLIGMTVPIPQTESWFFLFFPDNCKAWCAEFALATYDPHKQVLRSESCVAHLHVCLTVAFCLVCVHP